MSIRQSNYKIEEDVLLCKAYMQISQDPTIGIYQTSDQFWSRIHAAFVKGRKEGWEDRSQRSLQARMQTLEKAVRKFNGCIREIESRRESGISEKDVLDKAMKLWIKGGTYKDWKFKHAWKVLKDFEKFNDCARSSRQASRGNLSSESENPASDSQASPGLSSFSLNLDDDDDDDENTCGGSSSSRPIGRKKAKLKQKQSEDTKSMIAAMQKQNEQLMEDMKTTNAQMEHHLAIQSKNYALKEMKEENKILYMDLNSISDPHVRAFTEAEKARILRKRAQQEGHLNPDSPYPSYFNNIGGSATGLPDY